MGTITHLVSLVISITLYGHAHAATPPVHTIFLVQAPASQNGNLVQGIELYSSQGPNGQIDRAREFLSVFHPQWLRQVEFVGVGSQRDPVGFAIDVNGELVILKQQQAKSVATMTGLSTKKATAVAPASSNEAIVVLENNKVVFMDQNGNEQLVAAARWLDPSPSGYGRITKVQMISPDRFAVITSSGHFVIASIRTPGNPSIEGEFFNGTPVIDFVANTSYAWLYSGANLQVLDLKPLNGVVVRLANIPTAFHAPALLDIEPNSVSLLLRESNAFYRLFSNGTMTLEAADFFTVAQLGNYGITALNNAQLTAVYPKAEQGWLRLNSGNSGYPAAQIAGGPSPAGPAVPRYPVTPSRTGYMPSGATPPPQPANTGSPVTRSVPGSWSSTQKPLPGVATPKPSSPPPRMASSPSAYEEKTATAASTKKVLDPVDYQDFLELIRRETRNNGLKPLPESISARGFAAWVDQTNTLKFYFKHMSPVKLGAYGLAPRLNGLVVIREEAVVRVDSLIYELAIAVRAASCEPKLKQK